jgi:hypothetical protein
MADDGPSEKVAEVTMDQVVAKAAAVNGLISKKSYNEALVKALEAPPLGSKSAEIKDANRDIVFKVIDSVGDKDIGKEKVQTSFFSPPREEGGFVTVTG